MERHNPGAGFTLLEVLVGLVVLGLILATLSGGVRFGQQALRAQARDAVVANDIAPVDTLLRTLIARAWPDPGDAGANFQGTARALSFRTVLPRGFAPVPMSDADVGIGVDAQHRLTLTWLPWYRNWLIARPRPQRVELLANLDHVEFAYWDPTLHLPPGAWVTAWVGESVPRLLRIRLVFLKGSALRWPDIIVATARDPFVY